MNRTSLLLNGSLALLVLTLSVSALAGADGSPAAVFGWLGLGLAAASLAVPGAALVGASRRR